MFLLPAVRPPRGWRSSSRLLQRVGRAAASSALNGMNCQDKLSTVSCPVTISTPITPCVPQTRCMSSQGGKGPQARKRFYTHVGVTEVAAPWEARFSTDKNNSLPDTNTVDSPISPGVDGTKSASGVIGHLDFDDNTGMSLEEKAVQLKERLIPRCTTVEPTTVLKAPEKWYGITLDGRTLRTPIGQVLAVPSKLLAWAIAAEWDAQTTRIQPVQMPLMTMTCTALDQTASHPEHYQKTALQFLPTDTTCFWADPTEDRILHRKQEAEWKAMHDFIEQEFDASPAMAMGAQEGVLLSRRNKVKGTIGLPHPETLYDACTEWTHRLDAWHLTALNSVASETKSFLIAYSVLHPSSPFSAVNSGGSDDDSIAKAFRAARVEEEFQIESWGLVEGQHDYDRLNCSVQVRSAKLLAKCVLQQ